MSQPATAAPGRPRNKGRFTSPFADLENDVVEFQSELDLITQRQLAEAVKVDREIAADAADDAARFAHYQRLERAIRGGADTDRLLTLFHALATHVEADELREDQRRLGRPAALRLLALKVRELRRIFHADFVPLILQAYAKGGR
jgi:hypothetical protein